MIHLFLFIITGRSKESLDIPLDILDIRDYFKDFYSCNLFKDYNYSNNEILIYTKILLTILNQ